MTKLDPARLAPLDTPTFTGGPAAPTPSPGDNDTSLATTAFVKAAIDAALASIGANPFVTGDIIGSMSNLAHPGWVPIGYPTDAGTIGDASSGATIRANVDCQALFSLIFTNGNDTNCPIQTSTGAATTRAAQGNNATTAWNAHCRISTPSVAGRGIGAAGNGAGLSGRSLFGALGTETVTLDTSTIPAHSHVVQGNYTLAETYFQATSSYGINQPNANTQNTGGGGAHNNMPPMTYSYWWMKL